MSEQKTPVAIEQQQSEDSPHQDGAGSTTQLLERNVKQIQIKEQSTVKTVLKTRQIKHFNPAGEQISPGADAESLSDALRISSDIRETSDNQEPQGSNHVHLGSGGFQNNSQAPQQDVYNNREITKFDPSTENQNLNYQNLIGTSNNSANLTTTISNRNELLAQQSTQPQVQPRATSRNSNVPASGYEELDSTLDYNNQHQPMNILVGESSIYATKSSIPVQSIQDPSLSVQSNVTQNGVTYINPRPSYEVDYVTAGTLNQMPIIASNAGIYGTRIAQEPIYAINQNGNITYVTNPGINNLSDVQWRDPELEEVISFLSNSDPTIRANSVAYLQHLSYGDDHIKQKARQLGAIPILIELLNRDMLEVQRNVCGALRNLSFGRKNDDNKRAIRDALGIQALIQTLVNNPDNEIRELATSVLWNLSSCEDIKWSIIDDALVPLVSVIIVPYTTWFKNNLTNSAQFLPSASETHWSTVFRNATGVLRNISSAGAHARKQLRDCQGLVESLFFIINTSISRKDVENKLVENCACILRNLSYRCQETQDADYDKHYFPNNQTDSTTNSMQNSPSSPSSSANLTTSLVGQVSSRMSENLGCFSFARRSKSKSKSSLMGSRNNTSNVSASQQQAAQSIESRSLLPPHHPSNLQANNQSATMIRTSTQLEGFHNSNATLPRTGISSISSIPSQLQGKNLLWQPDVVKPYLSLLSGCSNAETLEAAAGAIQNLAACYWQPSIDIRAAVRKERGLPVLVELLRMDRDRVVCVVATALRNLAIDEKNKDLIGKYAMLDLVNKLSANQQDQDGPTSDDTIAAVLATLHEVISNNVDFVRSFYEAGGLNKLMQIVRNRSRHSSRVQRFTAQVLLDMWKFTELRELYKKGGWKESHFIVRPQLTSKNSTYSVNSNTIERPMSSQQADRSSSVRNLRSINTAVPQTMVQSNGNLSSTITTLEPAQASYGTVQMTSLNGQFNNPQALYAQVDRQRKRNDLTQQHGITLTNDNC